MGIAMATAPKLALEYIVLACVLTDAAPLCQSGCRRGSGSSQQEGL